jgi:hypothetical protein
MNSDLIWYAVFGSLIPHLLRILTWARSPKKGRPANPLKDSATYIGAAIQMLLGIFGAHLLGVTTPLQAVAVAYAAPDVLTRLLASTASVPTAGLGAAGQPSISLVARILAWWRY